LTFWPPWKKPNPTRTAMSLPSRPNSTNSIANRVCLVHPLLQPHPSTPCRTPPTLTPKMSIGTIASNRSLSNWLHYLLILQRVILTPRWVCL
jgi:hypothetical protein